MGRPISSYRGVSDGGFGLRERDGVGAPGRHAIASGIYVSSGSRALDFQLSRLAAPFNAIERLMFLAAARNSACDDHLHAFGGRYMGVKQFVSPVARAQRGAMLLMHFVSRC